MVTRWSTAAGSSPAFHPWPRWRPRYARSGSTSCGRRCPLPGSSGMADVDNGNRRGRRPRTGGARRRAPADQATGALVLIGGACAPTGDALGAFIRLSGADRGAPLVGFTTASRNPVRAAAAWRRDFEMAGVQQMEIPIVGTRTASDDPGIAALVAGAGGIFLG